MDFTTSPAVSALIYFGILDVSVSLSLPMFIQHLRNQIRSDVQIPKPSVSHDITIVNFTPTKPSQMNISYQQVSETALLSQYPNSKGPAGRGHLHLCYHRMYHHTILSLGSLSSISIPLRLSAL